MARKRLVTVEGAVLLHLLDYVKHSPEDTLPLEMTQAGISRALGVRRSHVAQSLDTAIGQGMAEAHLSRVKGEKRKRKCYFLTHAGIAEAKGLRETALAAEVAAQQPGSEIFHGTLSDLLQNNGNKMKLPALALLVSGGQIKLPRSASDTESWPHLGAAPPAERFFGRAQELRDVSRFTEGSIRVLGVTGMPGIGKTALMARALNGASNVFWYRVSDWAGPKHAATHLAAFMAGAGSGRLSRYLAVHELPDFGDMFDILATEKIHAILVFDDCHKSTGSMQSFLGMLARASLESKQLGLCIVGRSLPSADRIFAGPLPQGAEIITLGPLDRDSSMGILTARGIQAAKAEAIADRGAGHPLYLSIADDANSGDVAEMLAREIQAALSDAENGILLQMSVYRQPVPNEALAETDGDMAAMDSLAKRSLLLNAGGWSMHSLLREFFYSRQTPARRESNHERAAEYYARYGNTPGGRVEELYHLFMAADFESAAMGLAENGPDILAQGYTDEILALCALVPGDWQNTDEAFRISFLKASALDLLGRWDDAAEIYRSCIRTAGDAVSQEREASVLRRLGAIEYRKGNMSKAREFLETALGKLESGLLRAEVQGSLGVVQWKMGDIRAAAESYGSDLSISEAARDLGGISRALNNLGILDWQSGNYSAALEKYSRSLACAEKIQDSRLVAIVYSNMGDVHRAMGNAADARRYYERCLALSEDLKFHWQTAEAYRGLAEVVPEKRLDYLSRALTIFERLGATEDAKAVREMRP